MKKILLVEDDRNISQLLDLHLSNASYQLTACEKGQDALHKMDQAEYDLLILDIALPDVSGLWVCKQIREKAIDVPIMMLTSRSDESDKVLALEIGADDYMTKPFGILELIARTKALIRRARPDTSALKPAISASLLHGELSIDGEKKKASIRNKRLELTPKEFDLLYLLASHPGKAYSRKELLEEVWGFSFKGYEHTVTAHINRLRLKIEANINQPEYILTCWGVGYRFAE